MDVNIFLAVSTLIQFLGIGVIVIGISIYSNFDFGLI